MKKNNFISFRLSGYNRILVILMALCFIQVEVTGQIEPRKKVITPATNSKIIKKIPKQVIPVNPGSGEAVTIILTTPEMNQRDVSLNTMLNWTATPATGLAYDVYIAKHSEIDANGNLRFEQVSQNQTATSFQPALSNGEVYHWKVVAKKSGGSSFESAKYTFFTPNTAPSAAVLTSPANGALQVPVTPTLSWQPSVDPEMKVVRYSLWIADASGHFDHANAQVASAITTTSYTLSTPLRHGDTYYWKVRSTDITGLSTESEEFKFTVDPVNWKDPITTGSFTDPRDNKTYQTVTIGQQVWMAENLAWLPAVNNMGATSDIPMYKVYDYTGTDIEAAKNTENYQVYGVLYNWNAAQQACPAGWHLPTDSEWNQLLGYLGMTSDEIASNNNSYSDIIVDKMRETATVHWLCTPLTVNNASHFNAVPAGLATNQGYASLGQSVNFWTSTWDANEGIIYRSISYSQTGMNSIARLRNAVYPWLFYSIRCVKD